MWMGNGKGQKDGFTRWVDLGRVPQIYDIGQRIHHDRN